MNQSKPNKLKIVIIVGYMSFILTISLIPCFEISDSRAISEASTIISNLLHIPVFTILSILFLKILRYFDLTKWQESSWTFVFCTLYGLIIEILQTFVPGRFFQLIDMGLNSIGAIIGITIYLVVKKSGKGMIYRIICE